MLPETNSEWPFTDILAELAESLKNYENIQEALLSRLHFHRFKPVAVDEYQDAHSFAAIDSSSATVVDAGCFNVIAYRVGTVETSGDKLSKNDIKPDFPIKMALVNNSESSAEKNFQRFISPLVDVMQEVESQLPLLTPPLRQPHPRDIDWLQLARGAEEWRVLKILIDQLRPGDFVLRDGPLRADIRIPPDIVEKILKQAAERGIHVIGITKRSSVPAGTGQLMPIVPAIQKLGTAEMPEACWYTPMPADEGPAVLHPYNFGESYIVQYHPLAQFVFLTDINKFDAIKPEVAFEKIAAICNDPVYIGYPYPLAYIHNNVTLTRAEVEDLRYQIQSTALETNTITPVGWDLLFQNFHDILDINIY